MCLIKTGSKLMAFAYLLSDSCDEYKQMECREGIIGIQKKYEQEI
jgi:hypothetical protein